MSGVELLNLQSSRDLARIRGELVDLANKQPPEKALEIFRAYRPEIVAFVRRDGTHACRMAQLDIDMEMVRLLLLALGQREAEEARGILVETVEYIHGYLEDHADKELWVKLGNCCHRLVECAEAMDMETQAQFYCEALHNVCRALAGFYPKGLTRQDHLELVAQYYRDMDRVFSKSAVPEESVRGVEARLRLQRLQYRRLRLREQGQLWHLARNYMTVLRSMGGSRYPEMRALALDSGRRALSLVRKNLKIRGMRELLPQIWMSMGEMWIRAGDPESLLQAKECYVNATEAARSYYRDCLRTNDATYDARNYLRCSYKGLAKVCEMLPGEKNQAKAKKYRGLAAVGNM